MKHPLNRLIIPVLAASLVLSPMLSGASAAWAKRKPKSVESVAPREPQVPRTEKAQEEASSTPQTPSPAQGQAPNASQIDTVLGGLTWRAVPSDAIPLSLRDVLTQTEKNDLEILLSQEKINETEVKQQDVEGKRMLFFFKYFNSEYLEGSAESDVMAAAAHSKSVVQESLLESANRYYALMRSLMAKYVAYQAIEQGKLQLAVNQKRFKTGESTNFEVMQTKSQLVKLYQDYLQTDGAYQAASLALGEQLSLKNPGPLSPTDLTFKNNAFSMPVFHLFPESLSGSEVVKIALSHRPELREMKFRRVSLENLIKAYAFEKIQEKILKSSLKQLDLKREKAERGIQVLSLKAFNDYHFAIDKRNLATEQLNLAATALRQAQVSHQSGFSSNKDVLDAQVAHAQAQVNYANSLIDYNLSQIQLLYQMGLMSAETLQEGKADL